MAHTTTSVPEPKAAASVTSERRVSIWSVPVDFGPWFYLLLVAHATPLVNLLSWTELAKAPRDNIASIIVTVSSGAAPLIFVAAVTTIIELEALMVLREWYREKKANEKIKARQEGRQEGYKEGFEAGREAEKQVHATTSGRTSDRNGNGE